VTRVDQRQKQAFGDNVVRFIMTRKKHLPIGYSTILLISFLYKAAAQAKEMIAPTKSQRLRYTDIIDGIRTR
jgi:hypothetical protein